MSEKYLLLYIGSYILIGLVIYGFVLLFLGMFKSFIHLIFFSSKLNVLFEYNFYWKMTMKNVFDNTSILILNAFSFYAGTSLST